VKTSNCERRDGVVIVLLLVIEGTDSRGRRQGREEKEKGAAPNFRTDPPTRLRKLRADRAAVEAGPAIDPQL